MLPTLLAVAAAALLARAARRRQRALDAARRELDALRAAALAAGAAAPASSAGDARGGAPADGGARRPVRVYMDGCFDGMHFGHANALRQARALGDVLVVGINPEAEIRRHKGPPVMTDEERRIAVESVKWVDHVMTDAPYEVTAAFLRTLVDDHGIDVIVHGDDPCVGADGQDVYKAVKEMGRFRTIKRTEGVSSTDIVGRMLLCTRAHHIDNEPAAAAAGPSPTSVLAPTPAQTSPASARGAFTRPSTFLPTTRRLVQFAGAPAAPAPGDRVVYVDGTFDMFHAGHIETLRRAREAGDFLLVGIHDDPTVNAVKGGNFPIMNLHERTLSVLSCKYVDEVIIGAPWCVTEDMIKTMNIASVVHGTHRDPRRAAEDAAGAADPYALPKTLGIYTEIQSTSDLTVPVILDRIVKNRDAFVERNARKERSEAEYLSKHKAYVREG